MRLNCAIGLLLSPCFAATSAPATPPALLDEPACRAAFADVARPRLLRADFTQEKTLPDVARPLRAKGELLISAEYGVTLRTLSPDFARSTKVMPLRPKEDPRNDIEARISRMVRAVLAGEYGPLSEFFSAQGDTDSCESPHISWYFSQLCGAASATNIW